MPLPFPLYRETHLRTLHRQWSLMQRCPESPHSFAIPLFTVTAILFAKTAESSTFVGVFTTVVRCVCAKNVLPTWINAGDERRKDVLSNALLPSSSHRDSVDCTQSPCTNPATAVRCAPAAGQLSPQTSARSIPSSFLICCFGSRSR